MGSVQQASQSTKIVMVNQLGYPPGATKVGVVITSNTSPGTVKVVNSSGTVVWTGGFTVVRAADANSGDAVQLADFSGFGTEGNGYRLRVSIGSTNYDSEPFDIQDDIYLGGGSDKSLAKGTLLFMTAKRCGMAIPISSTTASQYNVISHGTCHSVDSSAPAYNSWTPPTFDVRGGWHDAGDFGKYLESHTAATFFLGNLYERTKGKAAPGGAKIETLSLDIGDSSMPDILDELAWGTRWVRGALPNPTTHVSNPAHKDLAANKCTSADWAAWVTPDADTAARYCMGSSTSATHSAARDMAMVARLLAPQGSVQTIVGLDGTNNLTASAYADKLWAAAKEAFGRATGRHPDYANYTGAQASNMMLTDLDLAGESPGFNTGSGAYGDEDMRDWPGIIPS